MKLTKEQIMVAEGVIERGVSVPETARQLGVREGAFRYRLKRRREPERPDGPSRKPTALDRYEDVVHVVLERYMRSNDPDFETKSADIIGLYLNPPEHAIVFCVDEKTHIQALDRRDPVLPLSPGRVERHGFEYVRNGTLSLYAALDTRRSGTVMGKTVAQHNSDEFVAFLADLEANVPKRCEIHVIADNLSAHKTAKVESFLDEHRNVTLHFTPTYSSWLNQ